jgi:DNA recombination protein RmuC
MMIIAIAAVLLLFLGLLLYIAVRLGGSTTDRVELVRLRMRETDINTLTEQLREKTHAVESLQIENARLQTGLEHERHAATEKLQLLQNAEQRLKSEFENLANRIFEDKGKAFSEQSRERIGGLLQPLKEQIDAFRKRVDEVHQQDTAQSARLIEQVRTLHELSNKISEEANNLASAIKGDTKVQGDWGELVMERIFEAAGLERGREYETQVAMRSADGPLQKPDFMLTLPGDKAIILDAKVSLTAYSRSAAAADEISRAAALKEHVQSVRRHIEELRSRRYDELLGNRTLDFVIMCIPLEPAYQAALQADPELLYDLARTNVVLTGPATLMITLKLIAQIWRREHENRHAEQIAERAGRMHDQVALVYEAMEDASKRLTGTADAFALAMNRLKDGRGNLIARANELRRLGAKVSKNLPDSEPPSDT